MSLVAMCRAAGVQSKASHLRGRGGGEGAEAGGALNYFQGVRLVVAAMCRGFMLQPP